MQNRPLKKLCGFLATAAIALVLIGCRGSAGQNGANGTNGSNGTPGAPGTPGATYAIDASSFTPDQWSELTIKAQITGVTMGTAPVVNFKLTDGNNTPLKGFGALTSKASTWAYASYPNLGFACAKLMPEDSATGAPSRWVSYIVTSQASTSATTFAVPTRPTTDNNGVLVDNGDGTYRYTFRRDISQTKALLDAYTYVAPNAKADLDDVTYDPSKTHRITVFVGGIARGTGDTTLGDRSANTPDGSNSGIRGVYLKTAANSNYDFVPATGAAPTVTRELTTMAACMSCHSKFEFHGEGRQDPKYCMVCHNDQRKYGRAEGTLNGTTVSSNGKFRGRAEGDMPFFIHKIHMGEELHYKYQGTGTGASGPGLGYGGVDYNEVTYPQDHRNCVKCHTNSTATPQGDNWFKKPSRMACSGCHDQVDFQTGANHGEGGPQLSDQNCISCHSEAITKLLHTPVVPPNPQNIYLVPGTGNNNTNASFVAAFNGNGTTPLNLPVGAKKPTWEIKSFTLNASAKPVFVFRFLLDGVPTPFNTFPAKSEFWDNFVGGPSFYVAFTVPQDGITYPADWNATFSTYFKNIWRGDGKDMSGNALAANAKATLTAGTGADAGYYVLTFTDALIPTNAAMIAGGIGYTYGLTNTQPLTQTTGMQGPPWALTMYDYVPATKQGGMSVPAPNVIKYVSGTLPAGFPTDSAGIAQVTGARRVMVSNQKCNDCHGALGVFTASSYHAGQRNDAPTCEFCHNGQRVNSGWGVNTKDFVHAIHGASKRVNKYSWESSAGLAYWKITYPSVLNNCEICHVPGSYDFGNTTNAGEVPNLNWTTVASGTTPNPINVVITGNEPIPGVYWSQFAKDAAAAANGGNPSGYNFGSNFAYNASTGAITNASVTTLVSSPYVAACSNCHDSVMAINHMKANGGTFYGSRASVQANPAAPVAGAPLINKEQCFLCHSSGKVADVKKVHMEFR